MASASESNKITKILQDGEDGWEIVNNNIPRDEGLSDKPLSIITSIGNFGIGKSFLQNFILAYIEKDDFAFADEERYERVFPIETSVDAETKGIDMFHKYLEHPIVGKGVIALMDTEGPSDPKQTQRNANAVFGIAAYFSSILIYNVKEKFNTTNMDKLQTFLQEMRRLTGGNQKLFQDLVIVIRDFSDEKFGFGWDGGENYMKHMNESGCGDDLSNTFFRELNETFNLVKIYLMPRPNYAVATKGTEMKTVGDMDDPLFVDSVRLLATQIVKDILEPRKLKSGQMLTVGTFNTELQKFALKLKNENDSPMSHSVANMMKEEEIREIMSRAFDLYQNELLETWGALKTQAQRQTIHDEWKARAVEQFTHDIRDLYVEREIAAGAERQLDELIEKRFAVFNDRSNKQQMAMWIIGGVIITGGAIVVAVTFAGPVAAALASAKPFILELLQLATPLIESLAPQFLGAVTTKVLTTGLILLTKIVSQNANKSKEDV